MPCKAPRAADIKCGKSSMTMSYENMRINKVQKIARMTLRHEDSFFVQI
jgi:hypothetical protein